MFTGIITHIGKIRERKTAGGSLLLTFETPKGWRVKPGDSVATDGVCLTVKTVGADFYTTQLMPETLKKTTFGQGAPEQVNLERPLRLEDPLGGHIVLGHVDVVGTINKIEPAQTAKVYWFSYPKHYSSFIAEKGSIAVDGISLTIAQIRDTSFAVSLVEYTLSHTTLGVKQEGDRVNLEFDIFAKYIVRALENRLFREHMIE